MVRDSIKEIIREPSKNLSPRHLVSRGYLCCERLEIGEEIILTSIKICVLISSATRMFTVEIKNFDNTKKRIEFKDFKEKIIF